MHLLYFEDDGFIDAPDGGVEVEGQSNCGIWQRYLKVFDRVAMPGRRRPQSGNPLSGTRRAVSVLHARERRP